jgi:hypothetical protein
MCNRPISVTLPIIDTLRFAKSAYGLEWKLWIDNTSDVARERRIDFVSKNTATLTVNV